MKYLAILFLVFFVNITNSLSQEKRINPHIFDVEHSITKYKNDYTVTNDTTYDVNFYHLDLEIAIDSVFIQGNVNYLFTSRTNGLDQVILDLDEAFIIDSISNNASSFEFEDSELIIYFSNTYNEGDQIVFTVYYHGKPPSAGGYKGLRYETHNGNEPIIASLSTPYLAHTWWPCKDGLYDKADSCYIDITIRDTIISSVPVIAVSNGILDTVELLEGKKTFKWKHSYPVVPFYMMVAISNYEHFEQVYIGEDYSFPMDYYVFTSHWSAAQNGVSEMPEVMDFFTNTFGPYPFRKEKYGMTQLGYYGGIENQSNSIVNNMSIGWFNVSVHELAHQWFADMITCNTWNHGWLNEGFASYAEALYAEYSNGFSEYQDYMKGYEFYNRGTLYLEDVSNPFNGVFQSIIYNKGAYVLHMLRGVLGDPVFFEIIKSYATDDNFKYKHATTEDFQFVCEEISGKNLNYFFSQWVYDESYPVYRYNYTENQSKGKVDIAIHQIQGNNGWRNVFEMPMEVQIKFTDFSDTIVNVINNTEFQSFSIPVSKDVESVELDPNKWILKKCQLDPSILVQTNEIDKDRFELFPNPTNQNLYLKTGSKIGKIEVEVIDLKGKSKFVSEWSTERNQIQIVDTKEFLPGMYFVKIKTRNYQYVKKLVITE